MPGKSFSSSVSLWPCGWSLRVIPLLLAGCWEVPALKEPPAGDDGTDGCCPGDCGAGEDGDCCEAAACSLTRDDCCPSGCSEADDIDCQFAQIPAGSFWMGSPAGTCPEGYSGTCTSEPGRDSDEALTYVTLTGSFELMRTEVTQGDFAALMEGWNPSSFSSCGDNCPVERVSWYDAVAYANALSADQGLTPCYTLTNISCEDATNVGSDAAGCMNTTQGGINAATVALNGVTSVYDCTGYRLPTEAEWEYAIRAGSTTAFYPSEGNDGSITSTNGNDPNLDLIGWYYDHPSYSGQTHPVGGLAANAWGLYDMSGNVWEWAWDWYATYPAGTVASPLEDPEGPASVSGRVARGGFWDASASGCRSAHRNPGAPDGRFVSFGFRLSRSK